jgi:hypothetical protein
MSNGGGSQAAVHQKRDGAMPDSDDMPHEVDFSTPNVARIYDYYLLRHEALRYRAGVRDPRRQAVAAA